VKLEAALRDAAKGKFAPVYLLMGNEIFFRDKFRKEVVALFLKDSGGELVDHDLSEIPVRDALDDAATLGLFSPLRVVWLRNAEAILPKREGAASSKHSPEAIAAYVARPNPQCMVVFESRLDEKDKATRLEKILAGCTVVNLEQPSVGESAKYLIDDAAKAGFALDQRVASELVESSGSDLGRSRMELQKLMAYCAGRAKITIEDVRALVPAEPVFIIWELGDSIGRRDAASALERLEALFRQGHSAIPTLGLISSHMRRLVRAKAGTSQWTPPEVKAQAAKIPMKDLVRALDRLHQADLELRSSPPDDRLVLERLILDLSGHVAGNGRRT
jgi:DNA polymerase-3 subunit delta